MDSISQIKEAITQLSKWFTKHWESRCWIMPGKVTIVAYLLTAKPVLAKVILWLAMEKTKVSSLSRWMYCFKGLMRARRERIQFSIRFNSQCSRFTMKKFKICSSSTPN